GAGRATWRKTRGFVRSVIRRIVPPFPAVSRPSNTTMTLVPVEVTQCCRATSSPCRRRSSASYSLFFIFGRDAAAASKASMLRGTATSDPAGVPPRSCVVAFGDFFDFFDFFDFLPIDPRLRLEASEAPQAHDRLGARP